MSKENPNPTPKKLEEGAVKKGGVNKPPQTFAPPPPLGQSSKDRPNKMKLWDKLFGKKTSLTGKIEPLEPWPDPPKEVVEFLYKDRVKILYGFYSGQTGILLSKEKTYPDGTGIYRVMLDDDVVSVQVYELQIDKIS